MIQDFSYFEQVIHRASRQLPEMPRNRIVLNRLLFFISKDLDDLYNRRLEEWGLNTSSFLVLALLMGSEDNRLNPCNLGDALVTPRTNITRLTDEMVAAGWVTRNPSVEDRRRIDLSLTESGKALFLQSLPTLWELIEKQWADFDPEEVVTLDRLLRKMQRSLSRLKENE